MGEKTRCFELRTGEGQVVLSFNLVEKEVDPENNAKDSQTLNQGGNGDKKNKEQSNSGNNDSIHDRGAKKVSLSDPGRAWHPRGNRPSGA